MFGAIITPTRFLQVPYVTLRLTRVSSAHLPIVCSAHNVPSRVPLEWDCECVLGFFLVIPYPFCSPYPYRFVCAQECTPLHEGIGDCTHNEHTEWW